MIEVDQIEALVDLPSKIHMEGSIDVPSKYGVCIIIKGVQVARHRNDIRQFRDDLTGNFKRFVERLDRSGLSAPDLGLDLATIYRFQTIVQASR